MANSDLSLILYIRNRWGYIHARGQFTVLQKLPVGSNIGIAVRAFIIHVLNAGHTEGGSVLQSTSHGAKALVVGQGRNYFDDKLLGGILDNARGIALRIANN